jgi:hypothetical protein
MRQNRTQKKSLLAVSLLLAPKAKKKEQRPKDIFLSTPFERSEKQCVFLFNASMYRRRYLRSSF